MKHSINNRRMTITALLIAIALFAIVGTGMYSAFASAPSHSVPAKHSVAHKPSKPSSVHCGAIGRNIESDGPVGCKEVPTILVPTWQSNGENVSIAFKPTGSWTVQYGCVGLKNMSIIVTDVSRPQYTYPIIDGNTICDGQTHQRTYSYLPERAITISTDRPCDLIAWQNR